MATHGKSGSAFREVHKDLKKLYTRLNKLKTKIPVKDRDSIETASFHIRAAGINIATQF